VFSQEELDKEATKADATFASRQKILAAGSTGLS